MQSYRSHFGLDADPFRLVPDPDYLFWGSAHKAAVSALREALHQGARGIVVTGPPGTGKSTIIRHVVEVTHPDVVPGHVWHPTLLQEGFYRTVLAAFGLEAEPKQDAANDLKLSQHLRRQSSLGMRSVLLVDEAQTLPQETLERVLALATANSGLSVVLVGQPDLIETIASVAVQPDGPSIRLSTLSQNETVEYVQHRISQAGGKTAIFTEAAKAEIHQISGGVPRQVNSLCERCLYTAATRDMAEIGRDVVSLVGEDDGHGAFLSSARSLATGSHLRIVDTGQSPDQFRARPEDPAPWQNLLDSTPSAESAPQAGTASDDDGDTAVSPKAPALLDETNLLTAKDSEEPHAKAPRRRQPMVILAAFAGGGVAGLALSAIGLTTGWLTRSDPALPLVAITGVPAPDPANAEWTERLKALSLSLPADPEARFRLAVSLAEEDPQTAVVAYSHAAMLGHARAAYYLGQIFETGDGVPVDLALAQAWYQIASEDVHGAKASLEGLPPPQKGTIAAPMPLLGRKTGDGHAELSWISAEGSDPTGYTVEFATSESPETIWSQPAHASATRIPLPNGAARWRVVATESADALWVPSSWQPLVEPEP